MFLRTNIVCSIFKKSAFYIQYNRQKLRYKFHFNSYKVNISFRLYYSSRVLHNISNYSEKLYLLLLGEELNTLEIERSKHYGCIY